MLTEDDGSVTFAVPVSPVTKDDESVTSAAAPATKDQDMVAMVTEDDASGHLHKTISPCDQGWSQY